ncbi:alkaline phosphatase family protein [Clostridium sp. MD294]|uniref:LTA synthase family protein n=1 Tax=Clostridium sp. MD294 TaxID=97138 RepID=UPI0002CC2355|nr:alkaline phosphatase family protein [Clostridium sp. MD294]NDO46507.1 sulfatase-like hydrolase/transferase [Clostridium sp. MD294]USF29064.1 hypothetical protein C820_000447 [Clostridium sp. MD294]
MFHSTDVSPALGNITPKQTVEPTKTSHNNILKGVLTVIRYICFLPYPYLLTALANCISSYDINTISFLMENRTGAFYFGLIITSVLFISLCLIFSRAWLAGSILGICYTTLALADNIKFSILQEHLLPWDLLLSKNIEDFQPFLKALHITPIMILLLFSPVLYSILLLPRKPKSYSKKYLRFITFLLGIVIFTGTGIFLTNNTMRMSYTKWFDISVNDTSTQQSNYYKNGFLTAFLLNIGYLNIDAPSHYGKSAIEQLKKEYSPAVPYADFIKPDVIVILSESFWDMTTLPNTTFSQHPLENYNALSQNYPSGTMISSTFGGGTARPEFEVLTGMTTSPMPAGSFPYQQYMQKDVFSFARYFKNMGYDTIGLHTYDNTFYERNKAYPYMGFDEFRGQSQLKTELWWNSGPYLTDETLIDEIQKELEQSRNNSVFLFGITMENHSLYQNKFEKQDLTIKVQNDNCSAQEINALENFAKGVSDSDKALKQLYDYIMTRQKPTVVLWFGDHLPTLGNDFTPYTTTGALHSSEAENWTEKEIEYMFSTPYIVFANYDTGKDYIADKQAVTSYMLMPLLLKYINAPETVQSNMLLDLYKTCPVIHSKYNLYQPNIDPEKTKKLTDALWLITYDQLLGEDFINQ